MLILAIETSCDETSAAVVKAEKDNITVISNVISSSLVLHAETGGIIPEVAAREQVKYIIPVIKKALENIKNAQKEIDLIAVTNGPGLIGSLLVGVETAKTLAYLWNKPIIPINHLFGHIYANFISEDSNFKKTIEFPAVSLIISGGHTDLVLIKNHNDVKWLGGTRDDAAGEAFDKIGRIMGLKYPAGPIIENLAKNVTTDIYKFPRPIIDEDNFDFSFSGLKSAALREIEKLEKINDNDKKNLSYSVQKAIFDVVIKKTIKACIKFNAKSLLIGGGVAANNTLNEKFKEELSKNKINIAFSVPSKILCTDNAAMIAAAAYYNQKAISKWDKIIANPEAYFD